MDHLPNEMLLEVFSYLSVVQLLRVENVCQRWKQLIQAEYWDRVEWITKETIDYPDGDYVNIFIRLSRRVVNVKGFVNPFSLLDDIPEDLKMEVALRKATLQLAKKLLPDASFPLDVIQSVVLSLLNISTSSFLEEYKRDVDQRVVQLTPDASPPFGFLRRAVLSLFNTLKSSILEEEDEERRVDIDTSDKIAMTDHVVYEYGLYKFQSIRLDNVFIHSKKEEPFYFDYFARIPMFATITQLVIERFVIRSFWGTSDTNECHHRASRIWTRLSKYKGLASIEIARVHLMAEESEEPPKYEVILEFHKDRRQFSAREFLSMLESLHETDAVKREASVSDNIKSWFRDGRVKRAEMHVRSDFFFRMERCLVYQDLCSPRFRVSATIAQSVLFSVDTLHITHGREFIPNGTTRLDAVNCMKATGVFSQLKSLTISLVYGWQPYIASDGNKYAQLVAWNEEEAVAEVGMILRTIRDSLHSLEHLTLRFPVTGDHCPSAMSLVTGVAVPNGPLPRLLSLECSDLPCLPFIVSVVSQAPNLRRLSVDSKPFKDDSVAMRWINKLVDSLDACPRLQSLHITVSKNKTPNGCEYPLPSSMELTVSKRAAEFNAGLEKLKAKIQALCTRSSLSDLAVKADGWQCSFVKERHIH